MIAKLEKESIKKKLQTIYLSWTLTWKTLNKILVSQMKNMY